MYGKQARKFQLGVRNLNCSTTVACGHITKSSGTCPAGNVEAPVALMNRSLQPKGHCCQCLKDGCLQILLESAQVPEQALVALIRKQVKA